ncbi:MAG: hypothetical protein JETT_3366 [Candidatus Jettenia ecosi]|uniref:Uncharacterized protein n=1 Tax=Candidatus Jettenia ecosi TaxID=2494326 RepID=A0A533Q6Y4_9BACT|nr:MAG: hypothetical protein JETT_3366 [Candidatus Jettenia ecosi]
MCENEHDAEQRFVKLIDESSPKDSNLAIRCRKDASFRHRVALMIDALDNFYRRINTDALQNFTSRLNQWIKHPSTSYIGFFGELHVADHLQKWGVCHQFMREVQNTSTPDIELTAMGRKVYLEVKTLQENPHAQFFKQVRNEVFKRDIGVSYIAIRKIEIKTGRLNALVDVAVRLIEETMHKDRNHQIKYKGEEGVFYIYLGFATTVSQKPTGWISSWPESRIRANNTPWAQSVLEETLRDNIDQFRSNRPTFLAWVNLDVLLSDLKLHAAQVLERFGQTEFIDVVGITIFDLYCDYSLIENRCRKYSTAEYSGLFDAIRNLSIGKILGEDQGLLLWNK